MTYKARLFLDVDGVINAVSRGPFAWDDTEKLNIEVDRIFGSITIHYSPTMVAELEKILEEHDIELVWATTWNDGDMARRILVPEINALHNGNRIPYVAGGHDGFGAWKADGVVAMTKGDPLPYIWIDDVETIAHGNAVRAVLGADDDHVPFLHLSPRTEIGINPNHLDSIRVFLTEHGL